MTLREAPSLAGALGVSPPALVALVGGGGKTTALYRLLRELWGAGVAAVAATTTRIFPPIPADGAELVCETSWSDLRRTLRGRSRRSRRSRPPVLGMRILPSGKVEGIPPDWCRRLLGEGLADVLIVEADGAARRPLKAPEAWEPVVPGETTIFAAVVGLSCAGRPLRAAEVFRPERVGAVAGVAPDSPLTPAAVARVLASPEGLLKGRPRPARATAVLNQADLAGAAAFGRSVAELLLDTANPYELVVVGSLAREPETLEVWTR